MEKLLFEHFLATYDYCLEKKIFLSIINKYMDLIIETVSSIN